jgi:hypothetical protein
MPVLQERGALAKSVPMPRLASMDGGRLHGL